MIIKVNERIYLQTRNILDVEDDPDKEVVTVYFNTSREYSTASSRFTGQDRKDMLLAMDRATYDRDA